MNIYTGGGGVFRLVGCCVMKLCSALIGCRQELLRLSAATALTVVVTTLPKFLSSYCADIVVKVTAAYYGQKYIASINSVVKIQCIIYNYI